MQVVHGEAALRAALQPHPVPSGQLGRVQPPFGDECGGRNDDRGDCLDLIELRVVAALLVVLPKHGRPVARKVDVPIQVEVALLTK